MPTVDVYENFLKRSQAVAGSGQPLRLFTYKPKSLGAGVAWPTADGPKKPCAKPTGGK